MLEIRQPNRYHAQRLGSSLYVGVKFTELIPDARSPSFLALTSSLETVPPRCGRWLNIVALEKPSPPSTKQGF